MRLSIVIPARNESGPLASLLKNIRELDLASEVIVVDDGSTDDTAKVAAAEGATVIHRPYGAGNGAAIKAGVRSATSDVLVLMDADGQHDPADIPRLLARLGKGYDMVVGARHRSTQANIGRGLANRFYNVLASYMTGHRIEDLTSGFRVVRARKFREFLYLLPNGFSYPTTITMAFFRAGYTVAYEPIHAAKRIGKSHIRIFHDGARFLVIILKIGTLYSPLKIFLPLAFILMAGGLGWYGYTLSTSMRFTNMSALLITGGLIILSMGLISEQITALMYKDSGENSD